MLAAYAVVHSCGFLDGSVSSGDDALMIKFLETYALSRSCAVSELGDVSAQLSKAEPV